MLFVQHAVVTTIIVYGMILLNRVHYEGMSMSSYAVKVQGGSAKVVDVKTGAVRRSVSGGVVSAQIVGDMVQVTDKNGRVKVIDIKTGAVRRSF